MKNKELLTSIPGIGEDTAHWLLSVIQTQKRFDSARQLVAFIGLNPTVFDSGTSVHKGGPISKRGSSTIRAKLYFPSMSAIQCNVIIKPFYQKLLAKGKCKKVALIAAMRKLLHIAYGVIKHQEKFDKNFNVKLQIAA